MSITRGEIKYEVLLRLQKSAVTKGFYTDSKINSVIQEAQDYVATEMFLADEGWNHKLGYLDVPANSVSIPLPADMAMIAQVRYLIANTYVPLTYDQEWDSAQWGGASGIVQAPSSYRLVDNNLYFNPAIGAGGANYLQIEYFAYPRRLANDKDFIESSFDRSMVWFIVYHSCNMLAGQLQQTISDWDKQEQKWLGRMKDIISMRTRQCVPIGEFEG